MDAVALGARLLLALVFSVAAAGKLANMTRTRKTLSDFRVPYRLVRPSAWLLPLVELSVAVALLVGPAARAGAIAATVLLILFMAGVAAAMSRGETPDCNCFGQIGSAPAGRGTLIRNTLLAAIALVVLAHGPGANPGSWVSERSHAEVLVMVLGLGTAALSVATAQLWGERRSLLADLARANRSLAAFPPGLPIGAPAPDFTLPTTAGSTTSLRELLERNRPVALVWVSPSCRPCRYMLPDIARWQRTLPDRLTIALIAHASAGEARHMVEEFGLRDVLYQPGEPGVFRAYRGSATPSVVLITPEGRIASRIRSSQGVVESMIRTALHGAGEPDTAEHAGDLHDLDPRSLVVSQWSAPSG